MSGQVILYFDDQADALRFALAAGSVMSGETARATGNLVQETARATRIKVDDANRMRVEDTNRIRVEDTNKDKGKHPNPPERVA
jgi:hypothetical protein